MAGQDWPDVEGETDLIYRMIGADTSDPLHVITVAEELFGHKAVIYRGRIRVLGKAALIQRERRQYPLFAVDPRWQILLSRCAVVRDEPILVGHEVFEWRAKRMGLISPYLEQWCNHGARSLVMPGPSLNKVATQAIFDEIRAEKRGRWDLHRFKTIADFYDVTQTQAAIRYAEFLRLPLALVPIKGPPVTVGEPWNWGSPAFIHALSFSTWTPMAIARRRLCNGTVAMWPAEDSVALQEDLTATMDRVMAAAPARKSGKPDLLRKPGLRC